MNHVGVCPARKETPLSNPSAINPHPLQELRDVIGQVNALTERLYDALEPVLLPVDSLPPCRKLVSVRRKNQVGGGNARAPK